MITFTIETRGHDDDNGGDDDDDDQSQDSNTNEKGVVYGK